MNPERKNINTDPLLRKLEVGNPLTEATRPNLQVRIRKCETAMLITNTETSKAQTVMCDPKVDCYGQTNRPNPSHWIASIKLATKKPHEGKQHM